MEEINEKLHLKLLNFNESKRKQWMEERKPFSVLFELTPRCNFNCIHCYLQNSHSFPQLSLDEIKKIIDILYDKSILFLTLTGGEILTRSDFLDIYMYAKRKGFLVELFTNGYLFTDEIIQVLQEYPPLLVDITLYGGTDETYYKVTGVKGALTKVKENCKKLKSANVRFTLKSPIISTTFNEINDMKKIADELGVTFVHTFDIIPTIDKSEDPRTLQLPLSVILKNEFDNHFKQIEKGERKKGQINYNEIAELAENDCVYACNVALNSFVIDYNGKMCPCMKLRHKGVMLTDTNYSDIWDSFKIYSSFKATENYKCKKCASRYYCDICPAEMDFLYDDMEYRPDFVCVPAKIRQKFYEEKITYKEAIELADLYDKKQYRKEEL